MECNDLRPICRSAGAFGTRAALRQSTNKPGLHPGRLGTPPLPSPWLINEGQQPPPVAGLFSCAGRTHVPASVTYLDGMHRGAGWGRIVINGNSLVGRTEVSGGDE